MYGRNHIGQRWTHICVRLASGLRLVQDGGIKGEPLLIVDDAASMGVAPVDSIQGSALIITAIVGLFNTRARKCFDPYRKTFLSRPMDKIPG